MDRKRRLMENNNGWPLRNQLFDGAPIALPLTHTVIGRGGLTPSFTRATTETGQKWDETGYLDFTALAGEMVFKGARREYNQWTTSSVSLASGANKSLTLAAGTYQFSMGAGTGTATFSGTGGATGTLAASTGRVSVAKTISAGTFVVTASVADLADLQVCNITGETDQTTIRPYVSVGVASAPAYHGSMVDGVKCFDTDRSGNLISTSGSYPIVGYVPWESRTNLCLQSNAFTTTWAPDAGAITVTQNAVSPDGGTTAWTLDEQSAALVRSVFQGITVVTATVYTASVFIKKTTGLPSNFPALRINRGDATVGTFILQTTTGVCTNGGSGITETIVVESYNSNFWRLKVKFTSSGTAAQLYLSPAASTDGTTMNVAAVGSAIFYGAQIELGSFATPYQPTTTIAVARNANLLTYTGADAANIKTLAATFSRGVGVTASGYIVALSDNTLNEFAASYLNTATQQRFNGYDGGVNQWEIISSNAYTPGATSKASWSMATNDVKADLDGTAQTADTSATLPAVTQLQVGHLVGLYQLNGPVNHIYGWTRNLSQSELGAIDA